MATRPPNPPEYPESPDRLERGLRGPVGGVTRIGPRAFGLAFLIICGLLVAILYGLNRGAPVRTAEQGYASPPAAPPTNSEHFGENEPIVPTAPPATPPPPLILPPTAVPDLSEQKPAAQQQAQAPAAPSISGAEQAAAAREQEAERERADAEAKQRELAEAALKSPIMANGASGGSAGGGGVPFLGNGASGAAGGVAANLPGMASGGGAGAGAGGAQANGRVQSTAYLQGPTGNYGAVQGANVVLPGGGNPKDFDQAQRFSPISPFEIVASSVIPAELITGIDSELPGLISAQVREDVYDSKTGRYLLIPRGARLVGVYNSDIQYGQTRVAIVWKRLIFPDTTSIDLIDMTGADVQGYSGASGDVDNHYNKIFGAAILTSILAAGASLSSGEQSSLLAAPSANQVLSQSVGTEIAQTGIQLLQKDLSIPPTIHVKPGYPFIVMVDRDIVLPGVYHMPAFPPRP